jgi:hypothetical protein
MLKLKTMKTQVKNPGKDELKSVTLSTPVSVTDKAIIMNELHKLRHSTKTDLSIKTKMSMQKISAIINQLKSEKLIFEDNNIISIADTKDRSKYRVNGVICNKVDAVNQIGKDEIKMNPTLTGLELVNLYKFLQPKGGGLFQLKSKLKKLKNAEQVIKRFKHKENEIIMSNDKKLVFSNKEVGKDNIELIFDFARSRGHKITKVKNSQPLALNRFHAISNAVKRNVKTSKVKHEIVAA